MATAVQIVQPTCLTLELVEAGLPLDRLNEFATSSGIKMTDLCEVVIPVRTLKHRRARNESLSLEESERLARLVRIFDFAVNVFGNPEKASRWLGKPKQRFNERSPLQMLRTEIGGRLVEEFIWQIADGMFA